MLVAIVTPLDGGPPLLQVCRARAAARPPRGRTPHAEQRPPMRSRLALVLRFFVVETQKMLNYG